MKNITYLKKNNQIIQYTPSVVKIFKGFDSNNQQIFEEVDENLIILKNQGYAECNPIEFESINLENLKLQKIQECCKFWEEMRFFKIINSVNDDFIILKANQEMQNNIDAWIQGMRYDIQNKVFLAEADAYYEYNNINIPYSKCLLLKQFIAKVRTEIVKNKTFHVGDDIKIIGKIQQLKSKIELENYNYKNNFVGVLFTKPQNFII